MTKAAKSLKKELGRLYRHPGALIFTSAIVLVGAVVALSLLFSGSEPINRNGYQVVYTTTGQAYFGKLRHAGGEYLVLETPYTAQDATPEGEDVPEGQQPSTTLVKVSQQTYGPEEVISIKSDQVLFWQNLRSDSKVAQAIER